MPTKTQLKEIKDQLEREAEEKRKEMERQQELQRQREERQRQLEEERQRNAAKPIIDIPGASEDKSTVDAGMDYLSSGFGKFTSDIDRLFSVETVKDLGKEIQGIVPATEKENGEKHKKAEHQLKEQKQREEKKQRKTDPEEKSGLDYISAGFKKFTSDVDKLFSVSTIKDLGKEIQNIVPSKEDEEREHGGWKIDADKVVHSVDCDEDDPFAIQREQLLSFIAQAQEAKRFDEVRALEASLKEIETEMREKQMTHGFS